MAAAAPLSCNLRDRAPKTLRPMPHPFGGPVLPIALQSQPLRRNSLCLSVSERVAPSATAASAELTDRAALSCDP
jgi:hypothetical protein